MSVGMTVLPARFTIVAPCGTRTSTAAPAWAILAPSTSSVPFSIEGRPSPTMIRTPSNAVTVGAWARAGTDDPPKAASVRAAVKATALTPRIKTSPAEMNLHSIALVLGEAEASWGRTREAYSAKPVLRRNTLRYCPVPCSSAGVRGRCAGVDAVSVVVGSKLAKLTAIARPTYVVAGQVDAGRRLKVGGEPDDASGECQSLSTLNLPGANGLRGEVDGVQMPDSE